MCFGYILRDSVLHCSVTRKTNELLCEPMISTKKVERTMPDGALRLLKAATRALVPGASQPPQWHMVPGALVGKAAVRHQQIAAARAQAANVKDARAVEGWCLHEVRRKGIELFALVFERHVVVQMPDGQLLCPNTPVGQEIRFVEDTSRAPDPQDQASWNTAIFANTTLRGSLGTAPSNVLSWATNWQGDQAYSTQERHARFLAWADGDPLARLQALGVSQPALLDVAMGSDLDELCRALAIQPHPGALDPVALQQLLKALRQMQSTGVFKPQPAEHAAAQA